MALMTFAKSGVTTVTLSRGDTFPRTFETDDGQIVDQSEGGAVWVATIRQPITILSLGWTGQTSLPEADYLALVAFFEHANVQLRAHTITFTDWDATASTVRYWEGLYAFSRTAFGLRQGTLKLRRELS